MLKNISFFCLLFIKNYYIFYMLKNIIVFIFLFFWSFQTGFWNDNFLFTNNPDSPFFQINFQRPSYILEKENTDKNIYFCDSSKEKCKINFNFIKKNWRKLSSTLNCEIKTDFESSQFKRCNPTTVLFSQWIHPITIRITNKKNNNNFSERKIIVVNGDFSEEEINRAKENLFKEQIKIIPTPVYSWEVVVRELISGEVKVPSPKEKRSEEIPEFKYIFQRPSYILETSENNTYTCDNSKWTKCKINFKLLTLEWKNISSKLECEIIFSTESKVWDSPLKKCNPNTIIFPKWNNKVVFKVFEKWNKNNFKERVIWVENSPASQTFSPLQEEWKKRIEQEEKHFLPQTKIAVQWKIWKTKKVSYSQMTCYTYKQCSINFTSGKIYKSKRKDIQFKWDFWNGKTYRWYNPKSVKFSPWFYKVKLVVTDIYWNREVEFYRVDVKKLYKKSEIKRMKKHISSISNYSFLNWTNNFWFNNAAFYKIPFSNIWKKKETKKKKKRKQVTHKKNSLSKNISLRVSFQKKNLKIYWTTFPNTQIHILLWKDTFPIRSDVNWKYIFKTHSPQIGKYKIWVEVYNLHWKLIAKKYSSEKIITQKYITQLKKYYNKKNISIAKKKKKSKKKKKPHKSKKQKSLAKAIQLRVSLQKKNLKLHWKTFPNSKIFFTIGGQKFSTQSDSHGKYVFKTYSLRSWIYIITASVYKNWKLIAQKSSKKKTFSAKYIAKMRSYIWKKRRTKRKKKSKTSIKTKKYTIQNMKNYSLPEISIPPFNIKLFVLNIFVAILSLILLFIVLIKRKLI